jgi:hypothetical protein
MARYFSDNRIAELQVGQDVMHAQHADLREKFVLRTYKTNRGAEFAKHGFCRRLGTLVRTIDLVYDLLPPEREEIPERDDVMDATIAIQAFTMNAFGCLDNIAWIWVLEKDIKNSDGTDLDPKEVGLGKKRIRNKLTKEF